MRKWLCFAALLGLLLAGCTPADPSVPDEPLTEPDQEPLIEQAKELVIAENDTTEFLLVISEDASAALSDSLPIFQKQLKEQTGVTYSMDTDRTDRDETAPEILIGNTNRAATQDLLADLPEHSYGIRITEDKVVIVGKNDSLTALAMYEFENNFFWGEEEYISDGALRFPWDGRSSGPARPGMILCI